MEKEIEKVMNDILHFRESIEDGVSRLLGICQNYISKSRMPSHSELEDILENIQNEFISVEKAAAELIALIELDNGIAAEKYA